MRALRVGAPRAAAGVRRARRRIEGGAPGRDPDGTSGGLLTMAAAGAGRQRLVQMVHGGPPRVAARGKRWTGAAGLHRAALCAVAPRGGRRAGRAARPWPVRPRASLREGHGRRARPGAVPAHPTVLGASPPGTDQRAVRGRQGCTVCCSRVGSYPPRSTTDSSGCVTQCVGGWWRRAIPHTAAHNAITTTARPAPSTSITTGPGPPAGAPAGVAASPGARNGSSHPAGPV